MLFGLETKEADELVRARALRALRAPNLSFYKGITSIVLSGLDQVQPPLIAASGKGQLLCCLGWKLGELCNYMALCCLG